jgi:5-methylcytosine-specific restriction endonuclease McrA
VQEFLISGLRRLVEKTADDFDPALLSGLTAARAIEEWAAIEKIACAQKLRAATRAEEVGLDAEGIVGDASGVPTGIARRQTRAARKAKGKTKDAFDKGKLSPTEVGAIADAAEANPDAEESLLELAETGTTAQLLDACERIKREAINDAELAKRQRQARFFRSWKDSLGMTRFSGALEPLVGAKLLAELNRRADRLFRAQSRAKGAIDTVEQRMADGLAGMLDELAGSGDGKRRGPRTVVRVIVSKSALERGWVDPGEKCETAEGDHLPMSAIDDALRDKDTLVQEVVIDGVDVQSIRTMKKYIPKRLRDALEATGVCCVVPTCNRTHNLQIDHTAERRDGGPTTLANLAWLCPYHHRLKTARLYDLWRDEQAQWHWEVARARAPAI